MKQIIQLGDKTQSVYREDELKIATALDKDCKVWFEAGAGFMNGTSLFDRSSGEYYATASSSSLSTFTLDESGKVPFFVPVAPSKEYKLGEINDEFSFICVIKPKAGVINRLFGYPESYTAASGVHSPHFFIGASNKRLEYNSIGVSNIIASVILTDAQMLETGIYTVTFSVENGVHIYRNGALVASNTAFVTPLDYKQVDIRNSLNASFGHYIIANADISKDENATKLKLIHDALKKRYSIA